MTPEQPETVAREGYRLRRIIDGARLLPLLGVFLVLLPILWAGAATRSGYIYLFVVWIGLIAVAAWLSRRLKEPDGEVGNGASKEPSDGSV